jgi:maleylpyruvate isomerase
MRLRLHTYWRSSASWRVRIGLGLKGLPWEPVPVHLLNDGGQHRSDAHRARNPMEQVPTLVVDEEDGSTLTLSQSLAILEYLEERFPDRGAPLLPAGAVDRARVRMLAEVINAGIQPLQNLSVTQRLKAMGADDAAWVSHFVHKGMAALEALAGDGAFLVGDAPTIAECCLVPQLYSCRRFGVDVSAYPRLLAVEARCAALPAFAAARPEVQADAG